MNERMFTRGSGRCPAAGCHGVWRGGLDREEGASRGSEPGTPGGDYLVKRLCDLTLQETAAHFGVESYGVVARACAQVRTENRSATPASKNG